MTMTIAFDVTLAVVALIASVYVGLEARNALVDEVNWYIPGQWDVYHKGELVKSDCTMDEATDYVLSDGEAKARVTSDGEWWLTYHGEPASDGFELSNRDEYNKAVSSVKKAANKAKHRGLITNNEYKRIYEEIGERPAWRLGGTK